MRRGKTSSRLCHLYLEYKENKVSGRTKPITNPRKLIVLIEAIKRVEGKDSEEEYSNGQQ